MSHVDLLHRWYDEVWNKDNYSAIEDLLDPNVTFNGPVRSLVLFRDDYAEVIQAFKALLPDVHVEITHALEQGDMASCRVVVSRKKSSHHGDLCFTGHLTVRVKDGRFVEFLSDFNHFQMYTQLGQLPEDAMAVCLTGEKLVWSK